jgi:predicted unusual protein kinase regulating ubiquinone biosynthesis (AarF/ABC1/UbiB family)
VGLLAGIATSLDTDFDPWAETLPFAQRLATDELRRDWRDILREGLTQLQTLLTLPQRVDSFLSRAERGTLVVQSSLSPETRKVIQRLERSIQKTAWMIIAAALLIAGVMLEADKPAEPYGEWLLIASGFAFLYGTLGKR